MLYIQFTVFINFAHPGNECPFWDFVWSGVTMICQQWNTTQTCCCCCLVAQSGPTLYNPVECRTPGFPVPHHLPQFAQIHVHWIGDSIQPSRPLSSPSPPTFSHFHTVHGVLKARMLKWFTVPFSENIGVGCYALLQGIFSTQGSNPSLSHCRQILYCLSHQGSPQILEWVAYPFCRGSFWPRNQTRVSCLAGRFFTSWATSWYHSNIRHYYGARCSELLNGNVHQIPESFSRKMA